MSTEKPNGHRPQFNHGGDDHEVGYGKPPVRTQFKKGQSGNPAGRKPGKANLATVLERALAASVIVTENGRRTSRSKLEVAVTQAVNKAAGGDLKALDIVLKLLPILDPQVAQKLASPDLVADRALALKVAQRLAAGRSDGNLQGGTHGTE